VRPWQWVDDGDGLRRGHADWRKNVEREAGAVRQRESKRGSESEEEGARTTNAKC
jgi:hypothetical protein